MTSRPSPRCALALAALPLALLAPAYGQNSTQPEPSASQASSSSLPVSTLAPIIVVATTPLLGIGTALSQVPANVQTVRARDLDRQHRQTLSDFFEKNVPSVAVNEAQGNPYQVDIDYRGFTASPLVGTPQGLSVFVDGVRVNEPFADVVNWDLIAEAAIADMQLIPGSNPTYGLNTLGGALAITTKNGKTSRGGEAELSAGSWGRKTARIEQGGVIGQRLDYYFVATGANDNGWADHNASRVRQAFGKLRYTDADTTLALSAGGADNGLNGSQTLPRSFLDNAARAYTFPDRNENSVGYLTLSGEHAINDRVQLSANGYYRHYRNRNVSSNTNADFGTVDPATGAIDTLQGTNQASTIATDSYGASVQITRLDRLGNHDNQWVAGLSADLANSRYTASTQDAYFTAARATIGIGDFVPQTNAQTHSANVGAYLSDTLSLNKQWTLTLSGRYDWSSATIGDGSGSQPQLDGHHVFSRLNPAVGLNWNPAPGMTAYAAYNEGMRVPTAIELACADPDAPCSLPNDFLSDPALRPVVSKTFELGARGRLRSSTSWSAAAYSTTLVDDIQFVGSAGSAQGYFQNVGRTRRQGIELAGRTKLGRLGAAVSYSYVDATYLSDWTEHSPSNSSASANGQIAVKQGNRIPGIPAHTAKLRLDYSFTPKWNVGTNVTYRSGIFARGDENNQDINGKIAGYLLIDLDTSYQATKRLQMFARVMNLLGKRFASFGVLGKNVFSGPAHTFDGADPANEQFVGVGTPRGVWVGMRYGWD